MVRQRSAGFSKLLYRKNECKKKFSFLHNCRCSVDFFTTAYSLMCRGLRIKTAVIDDFCFFCTGLPGYNIAPLAMAGYLLSESF